MTENNIHVLIKMKKKNSMYPLKFKPDFFESCQIASSKFWNGSCMSKFKLFTCCWRIWKLLLRLVLHSTFSFIFALCMIFLHSADSIIVLTYALGCVLTWRSNTFQVFTRITPSYFIMTNIFLWKEFALSFSLGGVTLVWDRSQSFTFLKPLFYYIKLPL